MAVYRLNTNNASWHDASHWDLWDGSQWTSAVNYPSVGDMAYLNGKNILTTQNITAGIVDNYATDEYGVGEIIQGGRIYCNSNITLTLTFDEIRCVYPSVSTAFISHNYNSTSIRAYCNANKIVVGVNTPFCGCAYGLNDFTINCPNIQMESGSILFFGGTTSHTRALNGNVFCDSEFYIYAGINTSTFVITGNIQNASLKRADSSTTIVNINMTVTGSISLKNLTYMTLNAPTINGTFEIKNSFSFATVNIVGTLIARDSKHLNCSSSLNINGQIKYESRLTTNPTAGVYNLYTLKIQNPDTFTWQDITEPRVNPFVIVTDYNLNNRQQYPAENEVKQGTEYAWGEKVGTYLPDYPPESVVLNGYEYDNGNKTGNMSAQAQVGCVTKEDVREGVPLLGMGEVGTCAVPSPDDVREGVPVDNTIGTLIVQGGGDRLRIADFGYYTNAQSDTYIVDLTEQDKPKFAVAEERVLIEMFPDLDLDNIPEKYFDDLFVKYLKYRLIVEYYRTAGINSTFTPSEPTTEIVNYQNVRNEVWLNSANIYLKAWSKKYPESITKPQRILL